MSTKPLLLSLCALLPAQAQLGSAPYRVEGITNSQQFQTPWNGPGAAAFNPAMVAETERFEVYGGLFQSVSGKGSSSTLTASARIVGGLYAGLGGFWNGTAIDAPNAVYAEAVYVPRLAYGWRDIAGSDYSLDFGAGSP